MVTEIRGKSQDSATVLALLCAQDTLEEARIYEAEVYRKKRQQEKEVPRSPQL